MKGKRVLALWMAALLLVLSGCGGRSGSVDMATADSAPASSAETAGGNWAADGNLSMSQGTAADRAESSVFQNSGAKLIRRAELSIQTTEFEQAMAALDELVIAHGGYYESASVYGGSYRDARANRSGEYVIRVPADQFLAFQTSTGALGYVTRSVESNDDVGEQYYDTEARLKTLRTKQERLLNLLEQAATMEDIISLENALSDVEYEIEQLSSTLNRYDALISYSTFHISLNEVSKVTEEVGEKATLWQRMAAGFTSSGQGLVDGVQDMLVWVSYNVFGAIFFGAVFVIGAVIGRRTWRKHHGSKEDKTE